MRIPSSESLGLGAGRIVVVPPDREPPVAEIRRGIVFILADWSAPAQSALRAVAAACTADDAFASITLYVADSDAESTHHFLESIGCAPAGRGESFWISDGVIVARMPHVDPADHETLVAMNRRLSAPK